MRRIALVAAAVLALPAAAGAQNRAAQATTGAALAALGGYAAFADRKCERWQQARADGGCYVSLFGGGLSRVGEQERPKLQIAGGLIATGVGGLMAAGLWGPSRAVDALAAAGVGAGLIVGAFDYREVPGTRHYELGFERFSVCERGNVITDNCTDASLRRKNMLFAGFGAVGLAVVRWFWHDDLYIVRDLQVSPTPGGVAVGSRIGF